MSPARYRITFVSAIPSPYQRDFFGALASHESLDVRVLYLDAGSPHNPWPAQPLRSFERILSGFHIPIGDRRIYVNWGAGDLFASDYVVLSTFVSSLTGQWLMRRLRKQRWLYWGECFEQRTGWQASMQNALTAPIFQASGVVGVGRRAEADFAKRFPSVPHFCIPYHCDLSEFFGLRRDHLHNRPLTFLFCGQMILRKGVDLLLRAFDRLIGSGLDARLLLIGRQAQLNDFLAEVSQRARAKISYVGFQSPERLPNYFAKADVFVLPSRYDGWGVVINQALAAGLPIISSDMVGAGLDLVESGVNGILTPVGDADSLQSAMEWFIRNPVAVRAFGDIARQTARKLTPQQGTEDWMRIFNRLGRPTATKEAFQGKQ